MSTKESSLPILKVENLSIEIGKKKLLENVSFEIPKGRSCALFGPNGSGKTSLLMTLAGVPKYKLTGGRILFDGKDITNLSIEERIKLGLGIAFQQPPEITGVKLRDIVKICCGKKLNEPLSANILETVKRFNLLEFLDRDINKDFSGGEKKRAEVLQLILMRPKLMLLDEPDSGVDLESLKFLSKEIENYLTKANASALIVTHHGDILEYIKVDSAFILMNGRIYCHAEPQKILKDIKERGYSACRLCRHPCI